MKAAALALLMLSAVAAQSLPLKGFPPPPMVPGSVGSNALDRDFYAVDGTDVFTIEQGKLVRRATDLTGLKARTKTGTYAAHPVPIGKNVYLQQGGRLYAFDRMTLKTLWTKTVSGELLGSVREMPLLRQDGKILRLNPATGAAVWTIGKPDTEHTPLAATLAGGVLLVGHSPAESFEGEIYSAHDAQTGRQLWQANLGHGRLLKMTAGKAFFDLRDWDNTLAAGSTFELAEMDLKTGKRRDISRVLPGLEKWSVNIGSPLLDDAGTLWLVLRVPGNAGVRLARVQESETRLWLLPTGWLPDVDNGEVRVSAQAGSIFVSTPGGVAVLRGDKLQTISLPLGAGIPTFTPLGRWLGLTTDWGTVIFDEAGKVKYQAEKAGLPALSGPYLLMPIEGQLTLFAGPKKSAFISSP